MSKNNYLNKTRREKRAQSYADRLRDQGYRRTSRNHRLVSRCDRVDWRQVMADSHVSGMEWVEALGGCAADHYRRCHSKDTITVPEDVIGLIPTSSGDTTGYVKKFPPVEHDLKAGDLVERTKAGGSYATGHTFTIQSFAKDDDYNPGFAICENGSSHNPKYLKKVEEKPMSKQEFKVGDVVERIEIFKTALSGELKCFGYPGFANTVAKVRRGFKGDQQIWLETTKDFPYNSGWLNSEDFRPYTPKPRFTNHDAYIEAMEETKREYARCVAEGSKKEHTTHSCKLCRITGTYDKINPEVCAECPHVTITSRDCVSNGTTTNKTYPQRIVELDEWIEMYREDKKRVKPEKVWEPEVGEMIQVSDDCEFKVGVYKEEFVMMFRGRYATVGAEGELSAWSYARPLKETKS